MVDFSSNLKTSTLSFNETYINAERKNEVKNSRIRDSVFKLFSSKDTFELIIKLIKKFIKRTAYQLENNNAGSEKKYLKHGHFFLNKLN